MIFAGGGFHEMAWRLAQIRTHSGVCYPGDVGPDSIRRPLSTREYYRILDKAEWLFSCRDLARVVYL